MIAQERNEQPMRLIDSHCHLDLPEFDRDRDEVLDRARQAGLVHMITIGIDPATSERAIDLARTHPDVSATVGHHPHDAERLSDQDLDRLKTLAQNPEVKAFGEIGLDFYRNLSPADVQRKRFDDLIGLGLELSLPLVIHERDAHQECYDRLASFHAGRNGGVIHCFSGDAGWAAKFLDLGFHISLPGTVTFKKAHDAHQVARMVPLDRLLIETDAPFLAPVPRRGKRNEPAYVAYTAAEIASLRKMDVDDLAESTTANARRLFGLDPA
jgi:TatD DNase family protein